MATEHSLLSLLADIVEPELSIAWQPALGHWLLFGLAILLLGGLVWLLYKRWQAGKAQRLALVALAELNWQDPATAATINQLLKRLLKSHHPSHPMLVANTENWQAFLQQLLPAQHALPDLQQLLYHEPTRVDVTLREQWWLTAPLLIKALTAKTAAVTVTTVQEIETRHA